MLQDPIKNLSKKNTDNIKQNKSLTMLCHHERNSLEQACKKNN